MENIRAQIYGYRKSNFHLLILLVKFSNWSKFSKAFSNQISLKIAKIFKKNHFANINLFNKEFFFY